MRNILIFMLILGAGLFWWTEKESQKKKEAEAGVREAKIVAAQAQVAGQNLAALQTGWFALTSSEIRRLNSGPALSPSQDEKWADYYTNTEGVTGHFEDYREPFNFIWKGASAPNPGPNGETLQMVDGPGLLLVKYLRDDWLLQRYEGQTKMGFWHGFGDYWSRNADLLGHHYLHYEGNFDQDRMHGAGVLSFYDFNGRAETPFRYEGEFRNNLFHGYGRIIDLVSGTFNYKGLWFRGRPFEGSRPAWQDQQVQAEEPGP